MEDFWRGKRVFITGHTGFKGTWLSLWLYLLGARVTGYSLAPPTVPSLFVLSGLSEKIQSIEGDTRDAKTLLDSMSKCEPEIVIHMAAQAIVRKSYREPVMTYSTNIMGTVHLLEAVRQIEGVKAVLNVTSDKCYENRECIRGYQETDPMGGFDPYSSSKGCAELITSAYRRSFFDTPGTGYRETAVASARAGNVIGGGDWAEDRLIPDIMKSFIDSKAVQIRSPHAVRPWQHVLDPLSGYLVLAEKLYREGREFAGGWNFGPPEEDAKPVSWIVGTITSFWGNNASFEPDGENNTHEAVFLKLDCTKARTLLGWRPRLTINQALDWTVAWYKQYQKSPASISDFTARQIGAYGGL